MTEHTVDVGYELLDRQIVDCEGEAVAKVDDLLFDDDGDAPRLVGILVGPGALAGRLGPVAGAVLRFLARLRGDGTDHDVVAWTDVDTFDHGVSLTTHRDDLPFPRSERWVRETIIDRIPGARHASG